MRITSVHNPRLRAAARLRERPERRRTGRTLVDGLREISRALERPGCVEELFWLPELCQDTVPQNLLRIAAEQRIRCYEVSFAAFARVAYGERSEGMVAVVRIPRTTLDTLASSPRQLVVVLEQVEKPGNIGAVARTLDATAGALILADSRTEGFNPNAIRASLGTLFHIPIAECSAPQARQWLEQHDYRLVVADVQAPCLYWEADLRGPTALILGSEAAGVSALWQGEHILRVRLPMHGKADSLNVSVAAAVLAFEWCRQQANSRQS